MVLEASQVSVVPCLGNIENSHIAKMREYFSVHNKKMQNLLLRIPISFHNSKMQNFSKMSFFNGPFGGTIQLN